MKFQYLGVLSCFFFISCFFPSTYHHPNYYYNSETFNKRLDYDHEKYLLNPVNYKSNELTKGVYLPFINKFFKKKLGTNVIKKKDYKDDNGKLKIPFDINYEISDSQIEFLKQNTSLNYIILTKTLSLEQLKNENLKIEDKRRFSLASSGAMSFIKIIDLKTNTALLEMSCAAAVIIHKNRLLELKTQNDLRPPSQPIPFYKNSESLRKKTIKKLLKKIK